MTTEQILQKDRMRLQQVNGAIASLKNDMSAKAQDLLRKFMDLRENIIISIESNERALELEKKYAGHCGVWCVID